MSSAKAITRRSALALLGAAGLVYIIKASPDLPPLAKGRLVLDYWEKWTGHEGKAMETIVDNFNKSQDKIFVRYVMTNSIHQKAMVSILGGNPPDILGLYAFNVSSYANANAVLDLADLARGAGLSLDQYAPGMRPVMTYQNASHATTSNAGGLLGGWYGIINTAGTLALYWNKSIFSDNAAALKSRGLNPTRGPRTISELDAANEVLSATQGNAKLGSAPLSRAGFIHMEPGWWSWIWPAMFGGSIYDPRTDTALAASPESIRAYEWVQTYPKLFGIDNVEKFRAGFGPYGTPQSAFLTGEVAMVIQGPWLANLIKAFKPDLDYGVAPLPVVDELLDESKPLTCIDTDVLMIPRGAKHPEASMEFIAFTQRQENVEALAAAHCKGSPLVKVSEEFLANHANKGVRLHTAMAASPRAFLAPSSPNWPEYKDLIDTAFQDIWKLTEPAASRLTKVQTAAQSVLNKAAAYRTMRGEG